MTNEEFIKIAINQDREDFIEHVKKLVAAVQAAIKVSEGLAKAVDMRGDYYYYTYSTDEVDELRNCLKKLEDNEDD